MKLAQFWYFWKMTIREILCFFMGKDYWWPKTTQNSTHFDRFCFDLGFCCFLSQQPIPSGEPWVAHMKQVSKQQWDHLCMLSHAMGVVWLQPEGQNIRHYSQDKVHSSREHLLIFTECAGQFCVGVQLPFKNYGVIITMLTVFSFKFEQRIHQHTMVSHFKAGVCTLSTAKPGVRKESSICLKH